MTGQNLSESSSGRRHVAVLQLRVGEPDAGIRVTGASPELLLENGRRPGERPGTVQAPPQAVARVAVSGTFRRPRRGLGARVGVRSENAGSGDQDARQE